MTVIYRLLRNVKIHAVIPRLADSLKAHIVLKEIAVRIAR